MLWLLKAGGFPMVFIVLFGAIALVASALFVRRPDERRLAFIRFMSRATLYSVGAGICADLASVFIHVVRTPEWARSPDMHLIVMEGLGESMAPGILGFTLLSLIAFLTALGARRVTAQG
jgi:hypothetical protein